MESAIRKALHGGWEMNISRQIPLGGSNSGNGSNSDGLLCPWMSMDVDFVGDISVERTADLDEVGVKLSDDGAVGGIDEFL